MFCSNCGKELNDQAYICPSCGRLVGSPVKSSQEKQSKKQLDRFAYVYLIVAVSIELFFSLLDLVGIIIHTPTIIWLIIKLPILGFYIVAFVFGLKQKENSLKLLTIFAFAYSVLSSVSIFI